MGDGTRQGLPQGRRYYFRAKEEKRQNLPLIISLADMMSVSPDKVRWRSRRIPEGNIVIFDKWLVWTTVGCD